MKKITLFLAALLISMTAFSAKLYLTPNANLKIDNARFAAYFFGNGEKWVSMTKVAGETDLYEVEAPAGYPNVIFCRMNPSASANNWNNKWNQTADLQVPTNTQNHYTVKEGTWDKGGGTWTVYAPEAPKTYKDITITIIANAQPKIHYWEGGDKMVGSDWESKPDMIATTEANTYSYTIKDVDAAIGVKYLIVVGDFQSVDLHTIDNVTANFKECLPQVAVMGVRNWDGTDKMTVSDDYKTATITLNLTVKDYEWKLTVNGEWFGGSKYVITRDKNSIIVAVVRKFVLLIPLIYIMPHLVSNPTTGVYMAEPVADIIAVTFTTILFTIQFKKKVLLAGLFSFEGSYNIQKITD
jgi:hypothetical protein